VVAVAAKNTVNAVVHRTKLHDEALPESHVP
jgi:hypothetical protein